MPELADWAIRLQQLTGKASQHYGRSGRRYQELLERVARGEIPPTALQEQFPRLLQEQAPALQRMTELNVAFLAGLIRLNAKYRDGFLDPLIPNPDDVAASDQFPAFDLTNWFQVLGAYATEQSGRAMTRYQTFVERVAQGEITPTQVQEHSRRFVEERGPEFVQDLVDLGFGFLGRLQDASHAMSDALYDRLLGPEPTRGARVADPPVRLALRGPRGAIVSASLVVENARPQPAEVTCSASEFAPVEAGRAFRALLEIVPPRFVLAPGQQREIDLHLTLEPALFEVGRDYVATLFIRGHGDSDLLVELTACAAGPSTDAAARDTATTPGREREATSAGNARTTSASASTPADEGRDPDGRRPSPSVPRRG